MPSCPRIRSRSSAARVPERLSSTIIVSSQFTLEICRSGARAIAVANLEASGSAKAIARMADESTIIARCPSFRDADLVVAENFVGRAGIKNRAGSKTLRDAHDPLDNTL